jgi:uncharacterized integral membrane protein
MKLPNRGSQPAPSAADHALPSTEHSTDQGSAPAPPSGTQPATTQPATTQPATTQPATTQPAAPEHHVVRRTRAGGVWVALALSAIVLLLLLVFILENQQSADISYFGVHGHLPLGVALLLAAVAGALLVVISGSARIMQLRVTARRHRSADAAAAHARGSGPQPPSQA